MTDIITLILVAVLLIFVILYILPAIMRKRADSKKKVRSPDQPKRSPYVVHEGLGARVRQRLRDKSFHKRD